MILPLINFEGEFCLLDTQDVLYLQTNGRGGLHFYTYEDEYKAVSMLKDWAALLQAEGFIRTDRGTIVNVRKIESYDPILHVMMIHTLHKTVRLPLTRVVRREQAEALVQFLRHQES